MGFRPSPIAVMVLFVALGAAISAVVFDQTYKAGVLTLSQRAEARLAQYNDRFIGQISRFQQLVNSLARHPDLARALGPGDRPDLSDLLLSFALSSGAKDVVLVDHAGRLVASSNAARGVEDAVALARRDDIRRALGGGLGWSHGLEPGMDGRKIYFARSLYGSDGPVIGAVALSVAVSDLEFEWSVGPEPVIYVDKAGVIFVTNRPSLALLRDGARVGAENDAPALFYRPTQWDGHELWRGIAHDILPPTALVLKRFLPRIGLSGIILQDVRVARERAVLFAILSALSLALVGAALWLAWLRRRNLTRQLELEEAANQALEARVEARTAELRSIQKQLIAAGRLTALGEMSAGISHELNQPLGAIRNFAENGVKLIARGRVDEAGQNFTAQIGQIDRIGRIIKSLRAFARNEEQEIRDIDLSQVVDAALAVSDLRLKRDSVDVRRAGLDRPVFVSAGQVRLQQVIVNIISNALDAMANRAERRITLALDTGDGTARLRIRDTGPGVAEPDKVFDPFYSTKDLGGSSGMGLGLSISHGIIGSFGGVLSCSNPPAGGAEFSITLPLSKPKAAGERA